MKKLYAFAAAFAAWTVATWQSRSLLVSGFRLRQLWKILRGGGAK